MNLEEHKETLKLAGVGVIAVIITGITVSFLAPKTEIGQIIKFFTPLIVGIIFGAKIYLKELGKVREKLE